MAFTKKTWKDRIAQYLNRRRLTDVDTGDIKTVTVTRDEGGITEEGDIFNAATMNDLENRINTAFTEVNAKTGSDIPVSSSDSTSIAKAIKELSEASTTTRPCLVTFTGAGQSLSCYVQIVGKVCIVNIFGNVNMGSVTGGTNLFENLPPIDGLPQIYQLTDVGRFRLWKSGNDVKIGIYEPTSSTGYVGLSFIYKTV